MQKYFEAFMTLFMRNSWILTVLVVATITCPRHSLAEEMMIYPVPSVSAEDLSQPDKMLEYYSHIGRGHYEPLKLRDYTDKRIERFETSFEECAPMRNSAANEWSAFGVMGGHMDFNAMGRQMWVRYPAFELMFRLYKDGEEIRPDSLDSFRLGLVNNRLPAIWGGWQDNGLIYKVSVMTVPSEQNGNYDLYKLEIQNPTGQPIKSDLVAALDGAPDLRLEDGVVRGLGEAPFVIADKPVDTELILRDWGLCDKRAKRYKRYPKKGLEDPIRTYRLGIDGLPVVYRFKAQSDKRYRVCLATPLRIKGYYIGEPKEIGDYIANYQVEGCPEQKIDYIEHIRQNENMNDIERPLFVQMAGAQDTDDDGYIEVRASVADESKLRYTALGMIYVFNEETTIGKASDVYSGSMNDQCVWHIEVGATPEQDWHNQYYDASDIGIARLKLNYTQIIAPGQTQIHWLKVPSIYRREAVAMEFISHAFRDVFPGEAIPPFGKEKIDRLKQADPLADQQQTIDYWNAFFAQAATFNLPDPVLNDIYLSRLATRAILDIKINEQVWYNPCSPFFYFDHAYRDGCYHVLARDYAGLYDEAKKLLNVYCMDVTDVKDKGPICFRGEPLQMGMLEDGSWLTRPGQHDTQGQNLWALVEHYKLTGDRDWLEKTAYPYIRRGAMWIVNSRHKEMERVGDPSDPRYGLIEPGAMEVHDFCNGVHMYYMDAFAILGLKESAEAAAALGKTQDAKLFDQEYRDLKACLHRSFEATFKRTKLYEGYLWYGVESEAEGAGMYGDWAHNVLVWPCGAIDPQDPMWTATLRRLDYQTQTSGNGVHVGWPTIGVDRAISYILRGEPEKTLDYFCAFTDMAGGTFSWGEGYFDPLNITTGDQPYNWADSTWIMLLRNLFVFEKDTTLILTPSLFRRWHKDNQTISVQGLATYFGVLDMDIQSDDSGNTINYQFSITPQGDQAERPLKKILLYPRSATGRDIADVFVDGQHIDTFSGDQINLVGPDRNRKIQLQVRILD